MMIIAFEFDLNSDILRGRSRAELQVFRGPADFQETFHSDLGKILKFHKIGRDRNWLSTIFIEYRITFFGPSSVESSG